MATQSISQDLSDLLITKNFDPTYLDKSGRDSEPADAVTYSFDWAGPSGKNYGTLAIVLGDENDMMVFFGDNLGRSMESPEDKTEWFKFLEQLSNFATQHRYTFSPKDINRLKHTMAGIAAIKEGLFEGYYGTRKVSYMGEQTNARLVIKHNRMLGENDKRYRYVESLFIETADGERFKLPFTKLTGGRAMLEHVRQGGKPYDIRGNHICEMVTEMNLLSRFNRASQHKMFEGSTQALVESAQNYYHSLQENLKHLGSSRGYRAYFESWSPADINSEDALVEDIKNLFVEQTIDTRIESALPLLAKIQQQGTAMKEVQVFETWINSIAEGTWALPDTPEQEAKLQELMGSELIAGPDGTNATEQLYDIVGDDQLFDLIGAAAEADPNSNIWDNAEIVGRLGELGIDTSAITQRGAEQTPEPAVAEADTVNSFAECGTVAGGVAPVQGALEESWENNPVVSAITRRIVSQRLDLLQDHGPEAVGQAIEAVADYVGDFVSHNDEIGTSDVSGWVDQVEQLLKGNLEEGIWGQAAQDPINYNAAITGSYYEDNEIVKNAKKLTDGWKGTLAGSAAGGIAGDIAGTAIGPAAGAALGGAIGGLPGAVAGGALGAVAGGPIGSAIGGFAGGKIGDKLGGKEETDEESDTAKVVKGAVKAATQGLADISGAGKEAAKNMLYMEDDALARLKSLALSK